MISVLISPAAEPALTVALEESGARIWFLPPLAITEFIDDSSLSEAIANLFGYDWLILKNPRAANYFLRHFLRQHIANELDDLRVVTIGSETAEAFAESHAHVDIALERFSEANVFSEIESYVGGHKSLARLNFLVPSANVTRELFQEQIEDTGARVDSVTAYRTCSNVEDLTRFKALLAGGGIAFVVLTESSQIAEVTMLFDTNDLRRLFSGVRVICLDQATNDFAINFGLSETMMPTQPSIAALAGLIKSLGH